MWTQDLPLQICELQPQFWPPLPPTLDPPLRCLFALGNLNLLGRPALSIVGARKASAADLWLAEDLARAACHEGLVVVSGLAHGIDAAAHRGARLSDVGTPRAWPTIAVLAHGLDRIYPSAHESMARDILAEGGLLLSEYPPGVVPQRFQFPQRNRLIAALTGRCVVIEAAARSGSLTTARAVLQQGLVMSVPGCPLDPRSEGGNLLLQQGAALVANRQDLLHELGLHRRDPTTATALTALGPADASPLERLAEESGLSAGEQMGLLLEWQSAGLAQRSPEGHWWIHPQTEGRKTSLPREPHTTKSYPS